MVLTQARSIKGPNPLNFAVLYDGTCYAVGKSRLLWVLHFRLKENNECRCKLRIRKEGSSQRRLRSFLPVWSTPFGGLSNDGRIQRIDRKINMRIKDPFLPIGLAATIGLVWIGPVSAQTLTILHAFASSNSEGFSPLTGLALSGNRLYGTTSSGGLYGEGTVFAINTDGTGFTNLHHFTGTLGSDESNPGLLLSGNILYGTLLYSGISTGVVSQGAGTIFSLNTDGGDFANLHQFDPPNEGADPWGGVILSADRLYGATFRLGVPSASPSEAANGTVFAINIDGTLFETLHTFYGPSSFDTNSDGSGPQGKLILSGNALYGATYYGGLAGNGTIFSLNTDGTRFTVLHSFGRGTNSVGTVTNSDGACPIGLALSGSTLYGYTRTGGSAGMGTLFAVGTNGTGFTTLHIFTQTNSAGAYPRGDFIASGRTLYGAGGGGDYGHGTVFTLQTDGTGFQVVHSFTGEDGTGPKSLLLSGNMLYGTTQVGGAGGGGTVFSISLSNSLPQLIVFSRGGSVILKWPTNAAGLFLKTTTNLISQVWTTNLPAPVVNGGLNTVTNPITATQQFFRLSQ